MKNSTKISELDMSKSRNFEISQPKKQYLVVMALIRNEEGKILMQKRVDHEPAWAYGKWEFPGGTIEWGESPEAALHREVKEEIGCDVTIKRLNPIVTSVVRPDGVGSEFHAVILCYECVLADGCVPRPSDPEVGSIDWFTLNEIRTLDTLAGTAVFIDQFERER